MVLDKKILQSALNAFIIAIFTQFVSNGADVFSLDGDTVKAILNAGISSAVWVVFRYVNTKDNAFGLGSK
jgi:hypothetical protein